jgi:hypothetical protein
VVDDAGEIRVLVIDADGQEMDTGLDAAGEVGCADGSLLASNAAL